MSVVAKFIVDEWFKFMAIICSIILLLAITVDLKVDNALVALLSLSGAIWGLGEMACRPFRASLGPNPFGMGMLQISGRPRRINVASCVLFALSMAVLILALLRAYPLVLPMIRVITNPPA